VNAGEYPEDLARYYGIREADVREAIIYGKAGCMSPRSS
jgi:hypothetical protein